MYLCCLAACTLDSSLATNPSVSLWNGIVPVELLSSRVVTAGHAPWTLWKLVFSCKFTTLTSVNQCFSLYITPLTQLCIFFLTYNTTLSYRSDRNLDLSESPSVSLLFRLTTTLHSTQFGALNSCWMCISVSLTATRWMQHNIQYEMFFCKRLALAFFCQPS